MMESNDTDMKKSAFTGHSTASAVHTVDSVQLHEYSTQVYGNMTFSFTAEYWNATAKPPRVQFDQTQQIIFLSVMFVAIVAGNAGVLLAIGLSKRGYRSRMNYFITNLAVSDISVAIGNTLIDLLWRVTIEWHAGNAMCKIVKFLQTCVTYASTYVLVALSIDRLDAIARPMNFSGSGKRARILIASAWLLSCCLASPMFFLNSSSYNIRYGYVQCSFMLYKKWHWKLYFTLVTAAIYVLPAIIITCCYTIIIYIIWSKSHVLLPRKKASLRERLTSSRNGGIPAASSLQKDDHTLRFSTVSGSSSLGVIPRAKIRTIQMTLVIVIAFVICWSPFFVFNLLQVYGHVDSNMPSVSIFIQSLTTFNSVANPIIYGIFSCNVRRRRPNCCRMFWKKLSCMCPSRQRRVERGTSVGHSTSMVTYATVAVDESARHRLKPRRQPGPT